MDTHSKPYGVVEFVVDHPVWSFVIMTIFAAICFFLYAWSLPWLIKLIGSWEPKPDDPIGYKGLFGDSFGALTSFFTVLALMALLLTFVYQKRQLELQKQQLDDERKLVKFQQVPLLSLTRPCFCVLMPVCTGECKIDTLFNVEYKLCLGSDYLVKEAFIKIELRCGSNGKVEVLDTCRSFAGIGGGYEPNVCDSFLVKSTSYRAFGDVANHISLLDKDSPVIVCVTIYYRNLLGLNIRMRRTYRVGEPEKNDANVVKMWSDKLVPGPCLSGNVSEDIYNCYKHFRVSMSNNNIVRFSLEELTDEATFEIICDNRYLQEVEVLQKRIKIMKTTEFLRK